MALPDLLVKAQGLYATPTITMHHLIGDAAYDVQTPWELTRQRGLIPAFAPGQPVEPPHVNETALAAGVTLSDTYQPICGDARPMPRLWHDLRKNGAENATPLLFGPHVEDFMKTLLAYRVRHPPTS